MSSESFLQENLHISATSPGKKYRLEVIIRDARSKDYF